MVMKSSPVAAFYGGSGGAGGRHCCG